MAAELARETSRWRPGLMTLVVSCLRARQAHSDPTMLASKPALLACGEAAKACARLMPMSSCCRPWLVMKPRNSGGCTRGMMGGSQAAAMWGRLAGGREHRLAFCFTAAEPKGRQHWPSDILRPASRHSVQLTAASTARQPLCCCRCSASATNGCTSPRVPMQHIRMERFRGGGAMAESLPGRRRVAARRRRR